MKKSFPLVKKAGFTLIEMLVYIAILTIVSGGALTLLFSLSDQINQGRAERLLTETAHTAMERILYEVRVADLVDTYYSTLETSPGVLTLTTEANSTAFSLSGNTLTLTKDGVDQGPLTSIRVTVDDLRFFRYVNDSTELVRVRMVLTATAGDVSLTREFNTATVLRGSYD